MLPPASANRRRASRCRGSHQIPNDRSHTSDRRRTAVCDSSFSYASHLFGDYVVVSLRIDERKVSPTILKKFVQKEEERLKKEKQVPKLGRTLKLEIKERVKSELTRKAMPVPAVYDLVWSLSESSLYFFSTNQKAQMLLEEFFKDCFGLILMLQIPYTTASELLTDDERRDQLGRIAAEIFV